MMNDDLFGNQPKSEKALKAEKALNKQLEVKKTINGNIGWLGLLSITFIGVIIGLFQITVNKEVKIKELLASIAISTFMGLIINSFYRIQAMINGQKLEIVTNVELKLEKVIEEARPYFKHNKEWSDLKMKESLEHLRTTTLDSVAVDYNDFFDKSGNFLNKGKAYLNLLEDAKQNESKALKERSQKVLASIEKTLNFKVERLVLDNLTNTSGKTASDPNQLGEGKNEWFRHQTKKQAYKKVIIGVVSAFIGYQFLKPLSIDYFIGQIIQLVTYNALGLYAYIMSMNYMAEEYPMEIKKRIRLLESLTEFGKDKELEIAKQKEEAELAKQREEAEIAKQKAEQEALELSKQKEETVNEQLIGKL